MAGGIGSRFWPMSRTNYPKQFHDILGTGKSLLQQTVSRFEEVCPRSQMYIVTNTDYAHLVQEQLPDFTSDQILKEPMGKNTAPCVAYSCFKISTLNPDARIVVAPSDHVILKEEEFIRIINQGLEIIGSQDILLTLGIEPSRPDTGYGYIQYKESDELAKKVKTFTEKPNLALAKQFLDSGDYVWNSGLFLWKAETILKALEKYMPDTFEIFDEGKAFYNTSKEQEFIDNSYPQCKSISIDYGVMEKSDKVYTLLSEFGWSDLGTWKSLYDLSEKDPKGNAISANAMVYDTTNCIIKSTDTTGKLLVVQGLDNYIIVESNDVIMICKKDEEQKVKDFVADVKKLKDKTFS